MSTWWTEIVPCDFTQKLWCRGCKPNQTSSTVIPLRTNRGQCWVETRPVLLATVAALTNYNKDMP